MNPIDIVIILVLISIFVLIIVYIKSQKKKGVKCIGCPFAKTCNSNKDNCNKQID